MEPVLPEELIGLYFDGVASANERQEAERLLSESHAAREWLAQLQQMHSALKELPQRGMPSDCASYVLHRAEQQILLPVSPGPPREPHTAMADSERAMVSRGQLWWALAVAAVALIVVVLPNVFTRQVAVVTEVQNPATTERSEFDDRLTGGEAILSSDDAAVPSEKASGLAERETLRRKSAMAPTARYGQTATNGYSVDAQRGEARAASATNSFAYVYDMPTAEAQQSVLLKFEETLRDQQIVLEDNQPAAIGQPQMAGGFGGGRMAIDVPAKGPASTQQFNEAQDRVYLIEATELQLYNTIHTLDHLTAKEPQDSYDPTSGSLKKAKSQAALQFDEAARQVGGSQPADRAGREPAKELPQPSRTANQPFAPAGNSATRGAEPAVSADKAEANNQGLNRSQAVQLSTEFFDADATVPAIKNRGSVPPPAATPLAASPSRTDAPAGAEPDSGKSEGVPRIPADAARKAQSDTRKEGGQAATQEQKHRAVIIFRVVPEVEVPLQPKSKS